jgi:hypothetical protein
MAARTAVVAIIVAATASLVACSSPPSASLSDAPFDAAESPPDFAGPYAAEYLEAWRDTDLAFVRDVLRDEAISDQEWTEVGLRMESCFAQHGIVFLGFEPDGGYAVDPGAIDGDRTQELLVVCEEDSGERWLSYLRHQLRINPANTELSELVAACLVRASAVMPGYSAEDYRRDSAAGEVPLLDPVAGHQALSRCTNDPLDLLGNG